MNEFGKLVEADRILGVSRVDRTAIGLRSVVAYPEGIDVDFLFLHGRNVNMEFGSDAIRENASGIRIGFSSSPDSAPVLASIVDGAINDDDLSFFVGNRGGGSAGDTMGGSCYTAVGRVCRRTRRPEHWSSRGRGCPAASSPVRSCSTYRLRRRRMARSGAS